MKIYRLAVIAFGLIVLSQFNNCTSMSDTSPFGNDSQLSPCDPETAAQLADPNAILNTDCAISDNNNLQVNPQGGDIPVNASLTDFNASGFCNDGAYPSNVITWTLKLNNSPVRNSGMTENGQPWNTQCVEGQFVTRVFLEAIPEDNVNRTGLYNPTTGTRTAYTLDVSIYGRDAQGNLHQNIVNGTRTINLFPE